MTQELERFQREIGSLFRIVKSENGKTINKVAIRGQAEALSRTWIDQLEPELAQSPWVDREKVNSRTLAFRHLIKVSAPNNLKTSYLSLLSQIRKGFRDDLIVPIQQAPKTATIPTGILGFVFNGLDDTEGEYLKEALDCAR